MTDQKVAAISGAGSGFGREFALACAERGMALSLSDVDAVALAETAEMLADTPLITTVCNVAECDEVKAWADASFTEFGAVHWLFNNAGVGIGGKLWDMSAQDWRWVMSVNVDGVAHGIRHFIPRMLAGKQGGHIVNTASAAGLTSSPGMGVYCASKHSVVALSECLLHDLNQENANIGVSVLCPGLTPTGIYDSHRNRPDSMGTGGGSSDALDKVKPLIERSGRTPQQVARFTLECIDNGSFYIFPHDSANTGFAARSEKLLAGGTPPVFMDNLR